MQIRKLLYKLLKEWQKQQSILRQHKTNKIENSKEKCQN
jgi:hypothetical protein